MLGVNEDEVQRPTRNDSYFRRRRSEIGDLFFRETDVYYCQITGTEDLIETDDGRILVSQRSPLEIGVISDRTGGVNDRVKALALRLRTPCFQR